jgi:hypothetical protein
MTEKQRQQQRLKQRQQQILRLRVKDDNKKSKGNGRSPFGDNRQKGKDNNNPQQVSLIGW